MVRRRKNAGESPEETDTEKESRNRMRSEEGFSHYEQIRDQRIKENKERLQKLGLFDLSLKLKKPKTSPQKKSPRPKKTTQNALTPSMPPRRSSRIQSLGPIKYYEGREKRDSSKNLEICIPKGTNPEVYTKKHEKLLGDCKMEWELYIDGYDDDGNRLYDPIKGQTCHQCRQKTLGLHTYCGKCELPQGEICGDCLYMRYGENVLEANENRQWICPACRGICNCSRCRRANGWMPTGNLYSKVSELGFKSVAHYLIQTYRSKDRLQAPAIEETDSQ
ncbi:cell division cycle-associated 7-like protein [Neltuma alba]|uniref:cell division cycle-associated 7-like protein n=1 Tax=Neltuma alba TaxID=207710 RepID=UPI0010A34CAB|nr:cell division cycle-associated 7-like protein [Prosopis alba]